MASQFDLVFESFSNVLDYYFAKSFTYKRGDLSATITATLQAHDIEAQEQNGLYESWHGHHFVIYSAEIALFGDPVAGDQIWEFKGGGNYDVFQVLPPPNKRVFEPIDPEQYQLLVYAKFVKTEVIAHIVL